MMKRTLPGSALSRRASALSNGWIDLPGMPKMYRERARTRHSTSTEATSLSPVTPVAASVETPATRADANAFDKTKLHSIYERRRRLDHTEFAHSELSELSELSE